MLKLIAGSLAIAAVIAVVAPAAPARAEIQYPWCAQYPRRIGGSNCGFVTRAQCMATISGIGGWCYENPAYPAASAPRRTRRR
jgi:hypothetical protein